MGRGRRHGANAIWTESIIRLWERMHLHIFIFKTAYKAKQITWFSPKECAMVRLREGPLEFISYFSRPKGQV